MTRKFFKLGSKASVFSDHVTGLKVTKNIPGSTVKGTASKVTTAAIGNGHIIEIDKTEFLDMMSKITPEEKEAAYLEQGYSEKAKSKSKSDDDDSDDNSGSGTKNPDDQEVRNQLLEKLEKLKMPPSKKEEASKLSNDELEAFIKKNK